MKSELPSLYMDKMETSAAHKYSYTSVAAFGTLGNILVIISILKQRRLLKNNYYLLVLQLAICDLGWLVVIICTYVQHRLFLGGTFTKTYCLFNRIRSIFHVAGIYMMLIISVLRYRAAVYPLKPDISRRKLKIICGLGYILGLIAGYGARAPLCFVQPNSHAGIIYWKFHYSYFIFLYYPSTAVMAVLYYKVCRALMNHKKCLKSFGSSPVAQSTSASSFPIMNYIKNRRTFLVCVGTVLCYGVGNLSISVFFIFRIAGENYLLTKHTWILHLGSVLKVAGSCSVNPLIYGVLDAKLLKFSRICSKKKRRP